MRAARGLVAWLGKLVGGPWGSSPAQPVAGPQFERHWVRSGDVRIYYQVTGAGPPVVLVHGLSASGRWWSRNVPTPAGRFRVHVIDLIGFGESRGRHPFVLSQAAGHLTRWMDQAGIERASVLGHSMGGFIAADLAANFPERVERLVLIDAVALPFEYGYARHTLGLIRWLRYAPLGFLPVLVMDAWRAGPLTIWNAVQELLTSDIREKLARIRAPTMVVWGEHDTVVPLGLGCRLAACLPGADLVVVEGAAHNPMWDRADTFNRLIVEFLTERKDFS